ncbi:uncharacterized protein [Mytilus edulis]|uniref:uncharacterized protein isoform X1 n=1 Tax=Mytilus edulis TaxID=6550 RepID=UPI0039EF57F7
MMKFFCVILFLQTLSFKGGYGFNRMPNFFDYPRTIRLNVSYCQNIANSVVTSNDCGATIDCRGTARFVSCLHRYSGSKLNGSTCSKTTSSEECSRKLQERQQACSTKKSGLLPDSKFCHLYYDCSNPAKSKICQYPKLFSTKTNTCGDFKKVKCGSRIEFKSYCQYYPPQHGFRGPPCELYHPNCEGYPDGANPHTEKTGAGSPWYMLCKGERFIKEGICPNARYGFNKKTCQVVECSRKINKYYPTLGCRGYIWCYYGRQFRYNCAVGTVFDYRRQSCQHVYDVCKPCGTKSC